MVRQLFSRTGTFLVIAVLSAELVTQLVLEMNPEGLGEWLRILAATAISALFAVAIGIGLFNRQIEMADEQRRQRLVAILEVQAQNMKEILSATKSQAKPFEGVVAPQIDPIALDEAVRSGLLSVEHTTQLYSLAAEMRMYNLQVGNLLSKGTADAETTAWLMNSRDRLIEHSEQVLTTLRQLKNRS